MKSILLLLVLFFVISSQAQTFKADAYGYVHDPKFRKLTTDRGYKLVGAFHKVNEDNKLKVARVLKGEQEIYIDLNGKEYEDENAVRRAAGLPEFYEVREPMNVGIPFDGEGTLGSVDHSLPEDYFQRRKLIELNGKKGLLYDGDTLFPPIYDKIQSIRYPDALFYELTANGLSGIADEKGKILIPLKYEDISRFHDPTPRLAYLAKLNGKNGILAADGSVTIPFEYPRLNWRKGNDFVEISEYRDRKRFLGALDTNGRLIAPVIYKAIQQPDESKLLFVQRDEKCGAIDLTGKFILDTIYQEKQHFRKYIYELRVLGKNEYKSGLFDVRTQQFILPCEYNIEDHYDYTTITTKRNDSIYYGLIDRSGRVLREARYEWLYYDDDLKLITLRENGKTGVTDTTGKIVLPFNYEEIRCIRQREYPELNVKTNYFVFRENGKYGLINSSNVVLIPAIYDDLIAGPFGAIYRKDTQSGVVDYTGKPLFAPVTFRVKDFRDGVLTYRNDQRQLVMQDFYGNTVVK